MTDTDVQQEQSELKLGEGITTQENHPDSSETATQKVQKTVKISQIRDRESRGSMNSAQQAKGNGHHWELGEPNFKTWVPGSGPRFSVWSALLGVKKNERLKNAKIKEKHSMDRPKHAC